MLPTASVRGSCSTPGQGRQAVLQRDVALELLRTNPRARDPPPNVNRNDLPAPWLSLLPQRSAHPQKPGRTECSINGLLEVHPAADSASDERLDLQRSADERYGGEEFRAGAAWPGEQGLGLLEAGALDETLFVEHPFAALRESCMGRG